MAVTAKRKIAIISITLSAGGAERFAGLLGLMLEKKDFEVHHIIINDGIDFHFNGKLLNLGKLCETDFPVFRKIRKGFLLSKYLKENRIDTIIDNRTRPNFLKEYMAQKIFGQREKYAVIQNFHLESYLPASPFLARILYKNTKKIICVSKAIEDKVSREYGLTNTCLIYNPVRLFDNAAINAALPDEKFILFFGRIDEKHKNLSLLLDGFLASKLSDDGYKLLLVGDGPDAGFIKMKIKTMGLENTVLMIPFTENPFGYVKAARFTVLTSNYEGFPLSVIESLALETPVVAVDCESGPREIITNGFNGLLIENHNVAALAKAMASMVHDAELYQNCKNNAVKSIEHLSLDNIAKQWQELLTQK